MNILLLSILGIIALVLAIFAYFGKVFVVDSANIDLGHYNVEQLAAELESLKKKLEEIPLRKQEFFDNFLEKSILRLQRTISSLKVQIAPQYILTTRTNIARSLIIRIKKFLSDKSTLVDPKTILLDKLNLYLMNMENYPTRYHNVTGYCKALRLSVQMLNSESVDDQIFNYGPEICNTVISDMMDYTYFRVSKKIEFTLKFKQILLAFRCFSNEKDKCNVQIRHVRSGMEILGELHKNDCMDIERVFLIEKIIADAEDVIINTSPLREIIDKSN
jgi:hypothetical protein